MSYKPFYSYKILPYLPSPSPPPIELLDSVDELSELEYTNYQSRSDIDNNNTSRRNSYSSRYPNGKFKRISKYKKNSSMSTSASGSSGFISFKSFSLYLYCSACNILSDLNFNQVHLEVMVPQI